MYLAGLIADDEQMTETDLQTWAEQALSNNISEYTVPWVAAGSTHGFEMALKWIDSPTEHIIASGWATLSNLVSLKPDNELPISTLKELMERVIKTIHTADNRVKYTMNGFIMAIGCYVTVLSDEAVSAAKTIGTVTVDMNGTSCKVPDPMIYITKVKERGTLGKKKKTVKC